MRRPRRSVFLLKTTKGDGSPWWFYTEGNVGMLILHKIASKFLG